MNGNLSASSLTQTWQVGPRRSSSSAPFPQSDPEETQSIISREFSLEITDKATAEVSVLNLYPGIHSLVSDEMRQLVIQPAGDPSGLFQVNVGPSGVFFINTKKNRSATINGNLTQWTRLRAGDEISCGQHRILCVNRGSDTCEQTIVAGLSRSELPKTETLHPEKMDSRERKFGPRLLFLMFGFLVVCSVAAYLGYGLAQINTQRAESFSAAVPATVTSTLDPVSLQTEMGVDHTEHPQEMTSDEFAGIIDQFRSGMGERACLDIERASRTQMAENIWLHKARLLFQRRCR